MKLLASSAVWRLVGSRTVLVLCLCIAGIVSSLAGGGAAAGGSTATLSFVFPEGKRGEVGVSLEDPGLVLLLPPGTVTPANIREAGEHLVRGAESHTNPDGSLRYEIALSGGTLDQVLYLENRLVLTLRPRFSYGGTNGDRGRVQYRIGPDDQIRISIGGHPDLTRDAVVKRNGEVSAPLVGEIQAAGRTVQEFADDFQSRLGEEFLVDPQVDVEVIGYNSQWVLVTGQVMTPGRVSLRGGTDLKEIIAATGGFTPLAGSRILVIPSGGSAAGPGERQVISRRDFESGITHVIPASGSVINVEKVAYAFIQGEVGRSGKVELEPGMTLLKAIAVSGGLTEWADRKKIRILDSDPGKKPKVYNLKRIQAQKDPDPVLREGQVVIVARKFL